MPGSLSVRNLGDDLIARLKRRAARDGRVWMSRGGSTPIP